MGLPIIGLVLSTAGSFLQANMAAQVAQAQATAANRQLKVDMENEKIRGMQEQNDRQEAFLRSEATNRVAIAASLGSGRNISYEQGLGPYNKKVAGRDLQTIGFNTGQRVARMAYEIKVNRFNAQAQSSMGYLSAFTDSLGAIGSYMSRPGGLLA